MRALWRLFWDRVEAHVAEFRRENPPRTSTARCEFFSEQTGWWHDWAQDGGVWHCLKCEKVTAL